MRLFAYWGFFSVAGVFACMFIMAAVMSVTTPANMRWLPVGDFASNVLLLALASAVTCGLTFVWHLLQSFPMGCA